MYDFILLLLANLYHFASHIFFVQIQKKIYYNFYIFASAVVSIQYKLQKQGLRSPKLDIVAWFDARCILWACMI